MNQQPIHAEADNLECLAFQARMADLLGAGEDFSRHPHFATCPRCRALMADLETIAEAARQLLPIVEPPDELWQHIESAIRSEHSQPPPRGKIVPPK